MSAVNPEAIVMDTSAITNLATLLRRCGNKILNGESKFILSAQQLLALNNLFSNSIEQREVYNTSFNVIPGRSNVKLEVYSDLQFLYDFVQHTLSLKLTSDGNIREDFRVCISRFKNIKLLDLQKLSTECVTGIRQLRTQLQFLNCTRSIKSLAEILEFAGGDHCSGFAWNELREAVFSHNALKHIDMSFQYTPWLITIDLSHNELTDLEGLNALENLKHLNVGYNKLSALPMFNNMISSGLQVLVLRANFLESLNPLSRIVHLRDLDISDNCLLEHTTALPPLGHLANLQHLHLQGNPLAYHPRYRTRTCQHLHRDTATVRFVLDGVAICAKEREMVGTYRPILSSSEISSLKINSAAGVTDLKVGDDRQEGVGTTVSNGRSRKLKYRCRARDAVISDSDENGELTDSIAGGGSLSSLTNTLADDDHLTTKRQIELLHKQYGENWLQAQAGSLVQEALGLECSGIVTADQLSSTLYDSDFMMHAADVPRCVVLAQNTFEKTEKNQSTRTVEADGATIVNDDSDIGMVKTNDEELRMNLCPPTTSLSAQMPQHLHNQTDLDADISEDEALDEGEQNLYLASIVDGGEDPVFLVLGCAHLTERESTRTCERARWPLATLNQATFIETAGEFQLEFDTIRSDCKERRYVIEDKVEAARLNKALQAIVERNSADESKFISYTCMKCSSKFNTDKHSLYTRKQNVCPFCKSSLVIRDS